MESAMYFYAERQKKLEKEGYDRAYWAVDHENASYFAQKGWSEHISLHTVFMYAATHKFPSRDVLEQIIRTMVKKCEFPWTFDYLLRCKASVWCLATLIKYKPPNENMEDMRFGFIRRASALHCCAAADHLSWLKYFVEDLEFKFHVRCWGDSRGYGVLYYAAKNDSLEVAKYLVHECRQSPTQKARSAFSKTPFEVATPSVRAFFQNSNCYYVRSEAIRQHGFDYQRANLLENINNNNNESAPPEGDHETSPLLRRSIGKG